MYPIVNQTRCNGCENCVDVCPSEVFEMNNGKADPLRLEDCIECEACVVQCPTNSIELHED
jgi:NAD-dependent dihydropyrimidine dehydrogenase PreA subunit